MNILAFDIETIPDVDAGRRLHGLDGLSDKDVARIMFAKRREQTGDSEFLRHHLHRVAAISAVLRQGDTLKIWSLGEPHSSEADLIKRFFDGIEKYTPILVSWNGGGFDLPVLHYRALKHGISAPRYWDTGDNDRDFKWNNYISRYHMRHTDLMDVLAAYQPRASAPLDEIAQLLGLPGKMGHSGAEVWGQFQEGKIEAIRDYCETDALNTYLIYLRFELMRGNLDQPGWQRETQLVRDTLRTSGKPHLTAFLQAWGEGSQA
jgi:predicted PolB exonuclease-like 3'-5' exonuclease